MQRVKRSTAVGALPSAPGGGTPGYFANPNPGGGVPATIPGYEWYNGVQEEIMAVVEGAGLTASSADLTQLKQAIAKMIYSSLYISDTKSSGTHAGASSAATLATRTLNTVDYNGITGASLASNKITLPAGTYEIAARVPACNCNQHSARLYNVTGAANLLLGSSENSTATGVGDVVTSWSVVAGRFTLAVQSDLEIRHWTNDAQASYGQGYAVNQSGVSEVYTQVKIQKVG